MRVKVDEAIQGRQCAVNTYPIILPPGFQSRKSAELFSIFPCLLKGRNHREDAAFFLKGPDRDENKHSHRVTKRAEGLINILMDLGWAACIKPAESHHILIWIIVTTGIQYVHTYSYLGVCIFACDCLFIPESTCSCAVSMKYAMFLSIVKNWKRQVKLMLWKSALTTHALKEGVIGREVSIIQCDSHGTFALGQLLFCCVSALCPGWKQVNS